MRLLLHYIRSAIGIKIIISISMLMIITITACVVIFIKSMQAFGSFATSSHKESLQEQISSYLEQITYKQASLYEQKFARLTDASYLFAQHSSAVLGHSGTTTSPLVGGATQEFFTVCPENGISINGPEAGALSLYWGAAGMHSELQNRVVSLALMDRALQQIIANNSLAGGAFIMIDEGALRYYPRLPEPCVLPPPAVYDIRNEFFYAAAGPRLNPDHSTVWTNIYRSVLTGEAVITACTPLYKSTGEFTGVAGIDVPMKKIIETTAPFNDDSHSSQNPLYSFMTPFLIDQNGIIIFMEKTCRKRLGIENKTLGEMQDIFFVEKITDSRHNDVRNAAYALLAQKYLMRRIVLDGVPCILAAHKMQPNGWRFGLLADENRLFASVAETDRKLKESLQQSTVRFAGAGFAALLLALVLAALLVKSLVTPLRALAKTARKVKDGDLNVRSTVTGADETGLLGTAFNSMLDSLQAAEKVKEDYTNRLEQKIRERTSEINDKNTRLQNALEVLKQEIEAHNSTEKSLRESNRLLKSRELELEAANQQLIATEQEIRQSQKFIENVFQTVGEGVIVCDQDGMIISTNKKACDLLGYSDLQIIERNALNLSAVYTESGNYPVLQKLYEHGYVENHITAFCRSDGSTFPVEVSINLLWHDPDTLSGCVVSLRDITERIRSEDERSRLISAIEQATELICIMDAAGTINYLNPACIKIIGYRSEYAVGRNIFNGTAGMNEHVFLSEIKEAVKQGRVWKGPLSMQARDGTGVELETVLTPVFDQQGELISIVAISRDITAEARTRKELQKAQKMEAIGTLAGGIAHDFNNILAVIMGYLEMSLDHSAGNAVLKDYLDRILAAAERARDLVAQILTFSRQSEQPAKPMCLTPLIKETLKFLRATIPATIEIRQKLAATNDMTIADSTQMHQILMNLCTNAMHAMRDRGGVLEVTLSEEMIDKDRAAQQHNVLAGAYLRLCVRDTGHGIPEPVLEKIFDPFFTTKPPGEGTGLGLSVVHGIVTRSGGFITVTSRPGEGTAFSVYLPQTQKQFHPDVRNPDAALQHGSEHILVVDDEKVLADMLKEMLETLGYKVTERTSSFEALECFKAAPDQFDLVITDQTMPNLTGVELAQELLAVRSDIPTILCTGFSETAHEQSVLSLGIRAFMQKPITRAILSNTIRKVLQKGYRCDDKNSPY